MKIKKDWLGTLFNNKYVYNILSVLNNKDQILQIQTVFEKIYEPYAYIFLGGRDQKNIEIIPHNKLIKIGNSYLLQLSKKEDLNDFWSLNVIRNIRDVGLYITSEKIEKQSVKEIKRLLFKSKFEFTIGNYQDTCQVSFDKIKYQNNISELLSILDSRL